MRGWPGGVRAGIEVVQGGLGDLGIEVSNRTFARGHEGEEGRGQEGEEGLSDASLVSRSLEFADPHLSSLLHRSCLSSNFSSSAQPPSPT